MVQTRIDERLEMIDQEIAGMKREISNVSAVKISLSKISKNLELMRLQSKKQQQMLLTMMETNVRERSAMKEKTIETSARNAENDKRKGNEASSSKTEESKQNFEDDRNERKSETDENYSDRNKFKKVEMLVFTGEDPDSWLFHAERYFQIHKLTESEKMLVSIVSFDGPVLNWFRSQEERDKFTSWTNLKERLYAVAPLLTGNYGGLEEPIANLFRRRKTIKIQGDLSLTKARVSLKNMIKAWGVDDEGFLVECQAVELMTLVNNDCHTAHMEIEIDSSLSTVFKQFEDVFEWPEKVPPRRKIEHQIRLKQGTDPINVRPYRYGFQQKEEMEKLVKEMLES
ncbi:transposon Tf2-1 polyprotein isoform X1 [Cucumis melo var. makuwa]|uniref:Transposon Tf2-1 polyprotein isoform X1 n=1 Tax=Cucumis melo var. makuwa TaxID=1194695 RepID=A0A5A7TUW2_CUCMM|nr:transposon Tf2-1 polyprotein isoform X1 [Cucumis melo var. makuwa]